MKLAIILILVCLAVTAFALALIRGAAILSDVMDEEIDLATGQNIDAPPPEGF